MNKQKISRRSFITKSTMIGVVMALDWGKIDVLASKIQVKKDCPVVVIGAGLGGLCCGALLAKQGFPVTVVEQHNIPGGYATTFDRAAGKFTFDVSLHRMSVSSETRHLLKKLNVLDKIELVKIPNTTRVITPNRDIRVSSDMKQRAKGLIESFPHEKRSIENYLAEMQAVVDELHLLKTKGGGRNMASRYPKIWKIKDQTVAAFLDEYIKEPDIKESLATGSRGTFGLPPSKLSAFMFIMAKASGKNEQYYIKRRSQDLSDALAESIEESSGQIIYGKTIEKIVLKDRAVSGVVTSEGEHLPAKIVISNANAATTLNSMLPAETIPPDYMNTINGYGTSLSTFVIWLGLNQEIHESIKDSHIIISSGQGVEESYLSCLRGEVEKQEISITIYDNYYKGYSKPGTSTITLIIGSGFQPWQQFESDYRAGRKANYNKEKERWARILMKRVEETAIPGLSSMVEVRETATPLTNWCYTKNPGGAIYGFNCSVDNSFTDRIKNRTPVKGLYLASAWGNSGPGYAPALRGGEKTFEQVLEDLA
ncbi:MAG: NAD(P)/FAD-dependent oxidoreductase [Desulfobacteraceae bacterium]|nr:NAD(P)/FAD-dependent oxidoreductase [Desulfobacteraceae bacterium]